MSKKGYSKVSNSTLLEMNVIWSSVSFGPKSPPVIVAQEPTRLNFCQDCVTKRNDGLLGGGGGRGKGVSHSLWDRLLSIRHLVAVSRCASYGELTVFVRNPAAGKIHKRHFLALLFEVTLFHFLQYVSFDHRNLFRSQEMLKFSLSAKYTQF